MEVKTITVRCESAHIEPVDNELVDVKLYNMSLSDLLCEFNLDDIWEAIVDADKDYEITMRAIMERGGYDGEE